MSRMLQVIPVYLQWAPLTSGSSMQHGRDMSGPKPKPAKSRRSLDEIVDDIVWALEGVGHRDLVLSKAETVAKVRRAVENSTEFFHRSNSLFSREGRATIAKDAGELADLIAAVERKLGDLPPALASYLFGPRNARHVLWAGSVPEDDILAATVADKEALLDRLERLRLDCQRQEPPQSELCRNLGDEAIRRRGLTTLQ
jgi:hypothetical protein